MTTLARRTREHTMPDGRVYVADAKLEKLDGNERPYFSLTGEEWKNRAARKRGTDSGLLSCGAMGTELVRVMPSLTLVDRLHLADDTGAPMHAEANGWYFYSGDSHEYERNSLYHTDPIDTPHERAARTLRVDPADLPAGMDRAQFTAYVETLRPQWQAEADAARAWLEATA